MFAFVLLAVLRNAGSGIGSACSVPVLFLAVSDPVRFGVVSNLARPGGNVTGVAFLATAETYAKRLQILKEAVPSLTRCAYRRK
jgi:putative ABC transport system substrate-binding protein